MLLSDDSMDIINENISFKCLICKDSRLSSCRCTNRVKTPPAFFCILIENGELSPMVIGLDYYFLVLCFSNSYERANCVKTTN